ncbi:50S ribosomal protein L9 [Patescibacteria group bacterium]|nr:50S ribosomal protein L9 [Patescibacteria group bacterium]
MKVILLQYVKGVGEKGDICDVSDGYAQNALIPRGLAQAATALEVNKLQQEKKSKKDRAKKEEDKIRQTLRGINGKSVYIKEKLNEKGTLYHAIGTKDLTDAIESQLSLSLPDTLYTEKYAFKESGEYQIQLAGHGQRATVLLVIQGK